MCAAEHSRRVLPRYLITTLCSVRSRDSNPGAATPQSLYKLYKDSAACAGNPYILRKIAADRESELGAQYGGPVSDSRRMKYAPVVCAPPEMHRCSERPSRAIVGMFRATKGLMTLHGQR